MSLYVVVAATKGHDSYELPSIWGAQRTWMPHTDFSKGYRTTPAKNFMSILEMSLSRVLIAAHIETQRPGSFSRCFNTSGRCSCANQPDRIKT